MGQMHHTSEEDMVLLTALLDGALDPQESEALRQRIAHDDTLHEAYLDLALIRDQLGHLPSVHVPRSLRLDDATLRHARGWRWWFVLPPGGVLMPTLGAVASLVVGVFFVQSILAPPQPVDMHMTMMAAPMMLEEAPEAQSRMLESLPASEAPALMADSAPIAAESAPAPASEYASAPESSMRSPAPADDNGTVMADSVPEAMLKQSAEAMPSIDMGYQQYSSVWFNWAIAGVVVSAIWLAMSLRWLMQVWWRQRHQRS